MLIFDYLWRIVSSGIQKRIRFYKLKMHLHGIVRFTNKVYISDSSAFEGANSLGDGTSFSGSMGYGTYTGMNCRLEAKIGRFNSISDEVVNTLGIHPYLEPMATTSPMFYSIRKQSMITFCNQDRFSEILPPLEIGNDCWIGPKVFFAGGLHVGDGAVVLAGAIVVEDVPPYAVVGGVPAKIIKYRYDEQTIAWLLKVRWWNKPLDWLQANSELLCDMEQLKKALDEN